MARVTVEDCSQTENRFELAVLAAYRAKEISRGGRPTVERDNDKETVIALREIAEHKVDLDVLAKNLSQTTGDYAQLDGSKLFRNASKALNQSKSQAQSSDDASDFVKEMEEEFASVEDSSALDSDFYTPDEKEGSQSQS